MIVQLLQISTLIIGSVLIGHSFGWMIGTGIALIAWSIMLAAK
jgi:hypothetical protein